MRYLSSVGECEVSMTISVEGGVVGVEVVVGHFNLKELGEKLGVDVDWEEAAFDHAMTSSHFWGLNSSK